MADEDYGDSGYFYGDDDYLYVEDEYAIADELAENQIPSPGYAGTNNEIDDGEDYDIYEYFGELEYGDDTYWDPEVRPPAKDGAGKSDATKASTAKRKRGGPRANEGKCLKRRKTEDDGSKGLENVVYKRFEDRLPPIPPVSERRVSFALLPDWKERFRDVEETKLEDKAMPVEMKAAAEGKAEVHAVVEEEAGEGEWEDEQGVEGDEDDPLGGLDPAALKVIMKQKLFEETGLELDDATVEKMIEQMLSGSSDDAAGSMAAMMLGQIEEKEDTHASKWLAGKGVRLEEEDDAEESLGSSQPDSAVGMASGSPLRHVTAASSGEVASMSGELASRKRKTPSDEDSEHGPAASHGKRKHVATKFRALINKFIEIQDAGLKGLGVFALKNISASTCILNEDPTCLIRKPQSIMTRHDILVAYNKLSVDKKKQFDSLRCSKHRDPDRAQPGKAQSDSERIEDQFYSNKHTVSDVRTGITGTGVYRLCSMLNHSCRPNCSTHHDDNGTRKVYAHENIAKGEELTFAYTAEIYWLGTAERKTEFTFPCSCKLCCSSLAPCAASDCRRFMARALYGLINNLDPANRLEGPMNGNFMMPDTMCQLTILRMVSKNVISLTWTTVHLFTLATLLEADGILQADTMVCYMLAAVNLVHIADNMDLKVLPRPDFLNAKLWFLKSEKVARKTGWLENEAQGDTGIAKIWRAMREVLLAVGENGEIPELEKKASHVGSAEDLFEIKDAGTKGLGVFATRDIPAGTCVITEDPIILIRKSLDQITPQDTLAAYTQLDAVQKQKPLKAGQEITLAYHDQFHNIRRFMIRALRNALEEDPEEAAAVYPSIVKSARLKDETIDEIHALPNEKVMEWCTIHNIVLAMLLDVERIITPVTIFSYARAALTIVAIAGKAGRTVLQPAQLHNVRFWTQRSEIMARATGHLIVHGWETPLHKQWMTMRQILLEVVKTGEVPEFAPDQEARDKPMRYLRKSKP
nr:hypothetical protein B0A51_12999 [Rachicladosporium sp. CCFEE 5018]